ncbi:MAG: hypothetical protein ABEH83_06505, partial [Halobacterium sp.]
HRTRVIVAGWLVFYAVFSAAALVVPDPTDVVALFTATAVTAVVTPALHVQLARHAGTLTTSET